MEGITLQFSDEEKERLRFFAAKLRSAKTQVYALLNSFSFQPVSGLELAPEGVMSICDDVRGVCKKVIDGKPLDKADIYTVTYEASYYKEELLDFKNRILQSVVRSMESGDDTLGQKQDSGFMELKHDAEKPFESLATMVGDIDELVMARISQDAPLLAREIASQRSASIGRP